MTAKNSFQDSESIRNGLGYASKSRSKRPIVKVADHTLGSSISVNGITNVTEVAAGFHPSVPPTHSRNRLMVCGTYFHSNSIVISRLTERQSANGANDPEKMLLAASSVLDWLESRQGFVTSIETSNPRLEGATPYCVR